MSDRHGAITRAPSGGIRVEMFGDWAAVSTLASSLDKRIAVASMAAQVAAAEKYRDQLKDNMSRNAFDFRNKPKYAAYKAALGGGGTPLMWSKLYYNSIIVKTNRAGNLVQVTVDENASYSGGSHGKSGGTNMSVKTIANILEHGSSVRKIQAFPLWSKTFNQVGGKLFFQTFMTRSIAQRLRFL